MVRPHPSSDQCAFGFILKIVKSIQCCTISGRQKEMNYYKEPNNTQQPHFMARGPFIPCTKDLETRLCGTTQTSQTILWKQPLKTDWTERGIHLIENLYKSICDIFASFQQLSQKYNLPNFSNTFISVTGLNLICGNICRHSWGIFSAETNSLCPVQGALHLPYILTSSITALIDNNLS